MKDILEEVKSFYNYIFTRGTEEEKERVDELFWRIEYNHMTKKENDILTAKITKEKIKKVILEMDNNETLGLNKISYKFYKTHFKETAEHLADILMNY
ncbi:hypothetical protein QYM36_016420 [Artemia franciscana]|uniref:Uncharacterized protein n=1 Tax=Artemia franciscana TaxID=6661 RepID=A0AA88H7N1_ARTSF|nr:hypothetical protein QYM36_016420 [Artemia franciscana]